MKTTSAVAFLSLVLCCASSARGETLEWTRLLGSGEHHTPAGVSADGLGNVYITSSATGPVGGVDIDAFLSKYDASGTLQWTRQLGTSEANDRSTGVSADGLGSVYITGWTNATPDRWDLVGNNPDAFISKYDAGGTLEWTRQLGTSVSDFSEGVSADGLGNVYISGYTEGSLGGTNAGGGDAFISKYDAGGTLEWTRQLGTSSFDFSNGVSADGLGNVYISGHTMGALGGPNAGLEDAFVSKYDADGTLEWTEQFGTREYDKGFGVSADGLGSVYISGYTNRIPGRGWDAFLSKYYGGGTLEWTEQIDTREYDRGFGVSADGLGSVYNLHHYVLSKYDASGTLQWTLRDLGIDVSADGLGNVYTFGANLRGELFVSKYTTDDVPEPGPDCDGDGDVDTDDVDALVGGIVLRNYDFYFDFTADGAVDNDDVTQWLSEAATVNGYAAPYLRGDANLDGTVNAADLNKLGLNWQQKGALWSGGNFEADRFLNSVDLNHLAVNWQQSIPTASPANASVPEPSALLLVVAGIALACRQPKSAFRRRCAVHVPTKRRSLFACLLLGLCCAASARGDTLEWTRLLGSSYDNVYATRRGVSADGLGNVYITGTTLGGPNAGRKNAFLAKYDANGALQWIRHPGTGESDWSTGVSADGLGSVYITGWTNATPDRWDFISKYDAGGTLEWTRQLGTSNSDFSDGVSADGLGSVYQLRNNGLSKYDAGGTLLWTQQLGESGSNSVSADGLGSVYISGYTIPSRDDRDAFLSKYDASGTLQWTEQFGTGKYYDYSYDVSADGLGSVYITGRTEGDEAGINAGSGVAFLSKYDASGTSQWTRQLDNRSFGSSVSADGLGSVYQLHNYGLSKYDASGTLQWTSRDFGIDVSADGLGNVYTFGANWRGELFVSKYTTYDLPEPGPDCDGDGDVDTDDVDALVGGIALRNYDFYFDFTADGAVDNDDVTQWLSEAATANGYAAPYLLGDANLDGTVNAADLNKLGLNWQQKGALWSGGNFEADRFLNSVDLNHLAVNWQQSIPSAATPASVPEPATFALLLSIMAMPLLRHRRRSGQFRTPATTHTNAMAFFADEQPTGMMKTTLYLCVLLPLIADSSLAVVTSDENGSHVTRPGELAFGVNVDGVALLAGDLPNSQTIDDLIEPFCTGALITNRHILTAAHCYDEDYDGAVDSTFDFPSLAVFESPGRTVFLNINSGDDGWGTPSILFPDVWPEMDADLAVIELKQVAPADLPRYALYGGSNELSQRFVLAGYGLPGHGATGEDDAFDPHPTKRAGLNRIEDDLGPISGVDYLAFDFDSGLEENNALAQTGFESDLGFGADEVILGAGDSGAPVFIHGAIAGVSAFTMRLPSADVTNESDSSWGEGGFAVRVSKFQGFILDATGGAAVFVPEPGLVCDFDNNLTCDIVDVDMLVGEIVAGTNIGRFDLNNDGLVNTSDRDEWLAAAATENGFAEPFLFGDANLDGSVNAADLNNLGRNWLGSPNAWQSGDFTADGIVDAADLNEIGQTWLASIQRVAPSESVPEPTTAFLLVLAAASMIQKCRLS